MTSEELRSLDDAIWSALTADRRSLGEGGPLARRFKSEVAPFATVVEPSDEAFAALSRLVPLGDLVVMSSAVPMISPPGFEIETQASVIQMILEAPAAAAAHEPVHSTLGTADVPDMLDLTARTRPGPFGLRTIEFGGYIGIRRREMLAAMAGERMRFGRFVEVSAICVDPAHRRMGYATTLTLRVAGRVHAEGHTPILHVDASNAAAIALYERLGFTKRADFHVTGLRRTGDLLPQGGPGGMSL